jgi:iron complex outermembrane receptor protein
MKKINLIYFLALTTFLIANETLSVTATKLSDSQMNSSASVDMISKKDLEQKKINNIEDISKVVSNINISGIGNRSDRTFTFRGVSNYVSYESSVAMYIDNIPVPFTYGYGAFNMNDVESIEVLKGAQGTLFGKNAESGVINIFTKPTTNTFQSEASIDIAQYNSKSIYARISGPTTNKNLTYALSLSSDTSDGYSKNTLTNSDFDKRDLTSISTKLKYKLDDTSDVILKYNKTKTDDGGSPFKINTKINPFMIDNEPQNDFTKMDNDLASILYTQKENNYKFTSSTTYAKQDIQKEDYVGILGGLILDFDIEIEEISQEFRLNYDYEKFNFLVGAFYSDKLKFNYKENQTLKAFNLNSQNTIENLDQNKALFAQARYWINANSSLSIGGRYQEITKRFSRDLTLFDTTNTKGSDTKTWRYITPTLSYLYYGHSNFNLFATYTQGYRPGGYNYRELGNALTPFKEENTDSFEIGYKSSRRFLNFESSIFYNDITNLRINTFDDNLATITLNAQKAYSYGVEAKVDYKKKKLNIYSTLGLIKAKIKELNSNQNEENKNIIDVPQMTANLGVLYDINNNYYFQSNINHVGKKYYNTSNTSALNGYEIVNIGIGYKNKESKILFYVNNLFDKEYSDFMIATPSTDYYHFGKPRVAGIKLSYKF